MLQTSASNPSSSDEAARRRKIIIPVSDSDAQMIDEARRALLARVTNTPMLPQPETLQMATYQSDRPGGTNEVEIYHVTVTFADQIPAHRARVQTMLRSHFGGAVKLSRSAGTNTWRFTVNKACQIDFRALGEIYDAIKAIASDQVEAVLIQGLFVPGLFQWEKVREEPEIFLISGDCKNQTSQNCEA